MKRRRFLGAAGLAALAGLLDGPGARLGASGPEPGSAAESTAPPLRPPRLRPGDAVGIVNPSGAVWREDDLRLAEERLRALELVPVRGEHVLERHGYLAGRDRERAADLNRMFADPEIAGVVCGRGGWGAARLLPHLDFEAVAAAPKVFLGYSDITALHMALHARSGLVTFHGPVGLSTFTDFSLRWIREILFRAGAPRYAYPEDTDADALVRTRDRVVTLREGRARGPLLGGNLTVLSAIVGSGFLPDFRGAILFLEDVGEAPYRIDRMLTQLGLAGILDAAAGVVFGKCTGCDPGEGYGSLTLHDVLEHHLGRLGVPAFTGAMIGHVDGQWTVPVGAEVAMDAAGGRLRLLEPAVR